MPRKSESNKAMFKDGVTSICKWPLNQVVFLLKINVHVITSKSHRCTKLMTLEIMELLSTRKAKTAIQSSW